MEIKCTVEEFKELIKKEQTERKSECPLSKKISVQLDGKQIVEHVKRIVANS